MIVFWLLIGRISGDNVEQKIFEEIFVGYNKEIRPVRLVMQIRDGRGLGMVRADRGILRSWDEK